MNYINKTSLLVPSQLPEFISENPEYSNFVLFLKAYYEWLESPDAANSLNTSVSTNDQGVMYASKNIPNYSDIDNTLDSFIKYYINEFMTFFPEGSLVDKRKLAKIIRQVYQSKGTPSSYKFLFKTIYNTDTETYNTKDYVFRASDGKWIVTRSLNLSTIDPTWLNTIGYKLFGETSKGYATIENVVVHPTYVEVVLSNIEQDFRSGEYVTVVDTHFVPVQISNTVLRSKIFGVLSSVTVDPVNIGEGYQVGDPVVFYGGLNPDIADPVGAEGYISKVSSATVLSLTPNYLGQGYRPGGYTTMAFTSDHGSGASAIATTFDTANVYPVTFAVTDVIGPKANVHLNSGSYNFSNLTTANINTTLAAAFTHPVINTYGIAEATVTSGGIGYDASTRANAVGYYMDQSSNLVSFPSIGILGPLTITNGGTNYAPGDRINFTGGSGLGAYGEVLAVDPGNGAIMQVEYTYDPANVVIFPKGGIGYQYALPSVSVASTSGHGAVLTIPGLVGGDATFNVIESPYGQVQEITLSNLGKDYISSPGVSLRVEDMLITNVNQFNKPVKGDVLYQGNISLPTAVANVDSLVVFSANTSNAFSSVYTLRVYDYGGTFNANAPLYFSRNGTDIGANVSLSQQTTGIYTNGRKIYGNGAARAKANFLNGIVLGAGIYENSDGQPSAYSILQDEKYNNYTYILQVQAALAKYKEAALSFLHPAGMNYFALNTLKNANTYNLMMTSKELDVQPLSYLLGGLTSYVGTFSPANGNVIDFDSSLSGANLANVVFANSYLTYHTTNGGQFYSKITGVTPSTITLQDSYITQVPNVVTATVASSDVIINTTGLTKAWSVATGNTVSHISDFISIYDQVSFDGVTYKTVVHVDDITSGNSIIVNTTFGAAQSGYLTLSKNTHSSNIFVSGFVSEIETIDLMTELGVPLTTEDMRIILLG